MKSVAVHAETDVRGRPVRFRQGRGVVQVAEILDAWEEAGCWWQGEEPRRVYRVLAAGGAVYELHHQSGAGWQLTRVFD